MKRFDRDSYDDPNGEYVRYSDVLNLLSNNREGCNCEEKSKETMLDATIKTIAYEIKEKMSKATLFGKRIDLNNNDQCIVAAHHMAKEEALKEQMGRRLYPIGIQ